MHEFAGAVQKEFGEYIGVTWECSCGKTGASHCKTKQAVLSGWKRHARPRGDMTG